MGWSRFSAIALIGTGIALAGCRASMPQGEETFEPGARATTPSTAAVTATRTATATHTSTPLPARIGPDYLLGFDPLTGLPVRNIESLQQAPLMVSVTNFPPSARPQSGLSLASIVWEVSIGQGMSRFLAVYYGDYLDRLQEILAQKPLDNAYGYVLAPVRSGRVVYEDIRVLYPDATLITRGASPEVRPQLSNRIGVFAANPEDVNSAGLTLEDLQRLPILPADPRDYASLSFSQAAPSGGLPAPSLRIIYNLYDHVGWDYDPARQLYLRSQDQADGKGVLVPAVDRLTGEQLAFENVLVIFANHHFENVTGTILEIDLRNRRNHNGWLFRDGQQFPVKWSSEEGNLTLNALDGSVLPLKPGKSFIQVVSFESTWDQDQRLLRFHLPLLPTLTPSPSLTPTLTPTLEPTVEPEPTSVPEETATPEDTPEP
jgi:hypothetical protein